VMGPGKTQQFTATATDALGSPVEVQPMFTWSVNGGGTISSNGLLTAANGTGGPFTLQASASNIWGLAQFTLTTNLARGGTGYTWYSLSSALANTPRATEPDMNDGDLGTDIRLLPGGGEDSANAYEAGGVVWSSTQSVARVVWNNGSYSANHDGVFAANFRLQYSTDGVTWNNAGPEWVVSPAYPYNMSVAGNARFEFPGGKFSVRGVRCEGQVHTGNTSTNSWVAFATEVEAYPTATLSVPAPSLWVECLTNGIAVSWPGWAEAYVLESTTNLVDPNVWVAVTNPPQGNGQDCRVTVEQGVQSQFFRLRLP